MALTPELIDAINVRTLGHQRFARTIEAEVRKDDTELIRQLVAVLEHLEAADISLCAGEWGDLNAAITAARARLETNT